MTTITAADLYEKAGRIIGARTGTIASGNATTAVLTGLVGTTGDDTYYAGDRLIFLGATAEGDKERLVTQWTDATGTATFATRSDATPAGERYMLTAREDYTLNEYRLALSKALTYSPRTYRQVIPLTPNLTIIPLQQCPWLKGAGDIDAAWLSLSPVMLHNEDMSLWSDGSAAAPDGYTLSGTGATIARQTGGMRSTYKAHITAGASAARLEQSIPDSLVAWLSTRTQAAPIYYPVRPYMWADTTDADSVRCYVYDGTTRHYADYIDADGVPQFTETALTPTRAQTAYTWGIEVAAGAEANLHVAGEVQNTQSVASTYSIKNQGSQAFREVQIPLNRRNVGGIPAVELPYYVGGYFQLVSYVRRPFAQIVEDDDEIETQYVPALTAGLLRYLLEPVKEGQDRSRLDPIMRQQASDWSRFRQDSISLPVPVPLNQWVTRGA